MLGHTPEHSRDQRMVTHDDKVYSNHRFMDIDISEMVKIYIYSEMNEYNIDKAT